MIGYIWPLLLIQISFLHKKVIFAAKSHLIFTPTFYYTLIEPPRSQRYTIQLIYSTDQLNTQRILHMKNNHEMSFSSNWSKWITLICSLAVLKHRPEFMRISFLLLTVYFALMQQPVKSQQPDKLQEFEQQLKKAINEKDKARAAFYSYEIGKLYANDRQYEKALDYFSECLSHGKTGGDKTLAYLACTQTGLIYTDNKSYTKALDYFQRALKVAEELNKKEFIEDALLHVATIYAQSGKMKKSIEPLEKALALSLREHDPLLQQKCYALLADYHEKLGNGPKAKEYQNLYETLVRSQQYQQQSEKQQKELERQKKTTSTQLAMNSKKLRRTEDSLLATKYSLKETELSLKETEDSLKEITEISEKRQLQIDLLNKDKELAAMRISEQETRLKNEALIRNSIIAGTLLAAALVMVIIRSYRKKIEANKKIDQQNKSIKSSINYAKRIQEAMLPKKERKDALLPESFVFFKPRDVVSGDFYWFSEIKSWYNPDVVFAAADCTGHGIPGALMSMIGINSLSSIVSHGIAETDQILSTLNAEIRTALQQETTGNNDGMDIALCIFRKEKSLLEFSGAKSPLVYIQDNKLFQVKGDIHPIGGSRSKSNFAFKKHLIPIDRPTMVYLFSDGYRDQFGSNENIKFMSKRFNELLLSIHSLPLNEQMDRLSKTLEEWKGIHHQTDDILVMGVRLNEEL